MDEELREKYSSLISLVIYKTDSATLSEKAPLIWNSLVLQLKENPEKFSQKEFDVLQGIYTILQKKLPNKVTSLLKLNFNISKPKNQNKENTDKSEKVFTFNTFKEAVEFGKLWANEFFSVTTHRLENKIEVTIKLRKPLEVTKTPILKENKTQINPKYSNISDESINIHQSPSKYVKSHNEKVTSFTIPTDTPIHLKCFKCNYEESAYKVMSGENQLDTNDKNQNSKLQYIKKVLPKLKCQKCGSSFLLLVTKEVITKVIYIATNSTKNNKFHRSTCGWMANVAAGNEIRFKSREDAIKTGFVPCASCKP